MLSGDEHYNGFEEQESHNKWTLFSPQILHHEPNSAQDSGVAIITYAEAIKPSDQTRRC